MGLRVNILITTACTLALFRRRQSPQGTAGAGLKEVHDA